MTNEFGPRRTLTGGKGRRRSSVRPGNVPVLNIDKIAEKKKKAEQDRKKAEEKQRQVDEKLAADSAVCCVIL